MVTWILEMVALMGLVSGCIGLVTWLRWTAHRWSPPPPVPAEHKGLPKGTPGRYPTHRTIR